MSKSLRQQQRRAGVKKRGRPDLYRDIISADGVKFRFIVHRNRVEVEVEDQNPPKPRYGQQDHAVSNRLDWRFALTEEQKLCVFAIILDEYRKHSLGDENGYRGAALGVVGDRIFLGANTPMEQATSHYFKECAEQNMVSAAADLLAYEYAQKSYWESDKHPKIPVFDALYIMGGVNHDTIPISCSCGKCTDMLAKNMTKGGKVYSLPILDDQMRAKLKTDAPTDYIRIDGRAKTLSELEPSNGHYIAWQTTIGHLNAKREIALDADINIIQKNGLESLVGRAFGVDGLLEERAQRQHEKLFSTKEKKKISSIYNIRDLFDAVLGRTKDALIGLKNEALRIFLSDEATPIHKAAENEFLERPSIAKLDCAAFEDGVRLEVINKYMLDQITHTLADRIRGRKEGAGFTSKRKWVEDNIATIRCVVVQLDDGTFRSALQAHGSFDTSLPNAEAVAAVEATSAFGRYGIRHVWVMEMNPDSINKGILPTSPKEGVERLVKRSSKAGLDFTYLPINSGQLSPEKLSEIVKKYTFDVSVMFPAMFKGSRPVPALEISKPKPWVDFLKAQSSAALTPTPV